MHRKCLLPILALLLAPRLDAVQLPGGVGGGLGQGGDPGVQLGHADARPGQVGFVLFRLIGLVTEGVGLGSDALPRRPVE